MCDYLQASRLKSLFDENSKRRIRSYHVKDVHLYYHCIHDDGGAILHQITTMFYGS